MENKKKRIFDIIQIGNVSDMPSRLFDYILAFVIVINLLSMFLETFEELLQQSTTTPLNARSLLITHLQALQTVLNQQ